MSSGSGEQVGVASGVRYEPSPDDAIAGDFVDSWPGANITEGSRPKRSKLAFAMLRLQARDKLTLQPP